MAKQSLDPKKIERLGFLLHCALLGDKNAQQIIQGQFEIVNAFPAPVVVLPKYEEQKQTL